MRLPEHRDTRIEYALAPVGASTTVWRVSTESATSTSAGVSELLCNEEYRFRVSSAGDGVSLSAEFGSPGVEVSARTGSCPVYEPFVIDVDPEYPDTNATVTLSIPDYGAVYQWQRWDTITGVWSDWGATTTTLSKTDVNDTSTTEKYRVVATVGGQNVESPAVYVTWDIWNMTLGLVSEVSDRVSSSTAYATAQAALLSCVNVGRSGTSTPPYATFDDILADYASTTMERMESGGSCHATSTAMFDTHERVIQAAVNELATSTEKFHLFLGSESGSYFEEGMGDGKQLRRLAIYASMSPVSPGELSSPLYVATSTSEVGGDSGRRAPTRPVSGRVLNAGLACLPDGVNGSQLTPENKLKVLNCLVFSTPHSFWVGQDNLATSSIASIYGHPRFQDWLRHGDWECTLSADIPNPACLKHDVAYDGLQRFEGVLDEDGLLIADGNELDRFWNPKNKALADLRFKADMLKYGCTLEPDDALFRPCHLARKAMSAIYHTFVGHVNSRGWPHINDDLRGFSEDSSDLNAQERLLRDERFEICGPPVFPAIYSDWYSIDDGVGTVRTTFEPGCTVGVSDVVVSSIWHVYERGRLWWGRDVEVPVPCSIEGLVVTCVYDGSDLRPESKVGRVVVVVEARNKIYGESEYGRSYIEIGQVIR